MYFLLCDVLWIQLIVLVIPGIQAFLRQLMRLEYVRELFREYCCFFFVNFAHLSWFSVSKRGGEDSGVGLREDLMGFQVELSYRLKVDT